MLAMFSHSLIANAEVGEMYAMKEFFGKWNAPMHSGQILPLKNIEQFDC
jgi:hypothetical protein